MASGIALQIMGHGIEGLVKMRLETAQKKALEEKARYEAWSLCQTGRLRQMTETRNLEIALHAAEQTLAQIGLLAVRSIIDQTQGVDITPPSARNRLTLGRGAHPEEIKAIFHEVSKTISSLPESFLASAKESYDEITNHQERLAARLTANERVDAGEITSFKEMVSATLDSFIKEIDAREQLRQTTHERLEKALNDLLLYRHLAYSQHLPKVDALRDRLNALLENDDPQPGQVEVLENHLASLKKDIEQYIISAANRKNLCASITHNLEDMGYDLVSDFAGDSDVENVVASMRIPGGEQLRISIQTDGQVGFSIIHERQDGSGTLSKTELASLRAQEKRWCSDLKILMRKLTEEGFEHHAAIERPIAEENVKIVVVETPDDILEAEFRYAGEMSEKHMTM
jgi:hypothetical protein